MVDLETLGTRSGCVILSVGAVFFSATEPEPLGPEFHTCINVESSVAAGLFVDPDTAAWWAQREPAAKAGVAAAYTKKSPSLVKACEKFAAFLSKEAPASSLQMWGNGSDFDNVILLEAMRLAGVSAPWKFYNHRCYRTLKNLVKGPKYSQIGALHNALDDAKSQAVHAVELLRILDGRGPPDELSEKSLEKAIADVPPGVSLNALAAVSAKPKYKRKF